MLEVSDRWWRLYLVEGDLTVIDMDASSSSNSDGRSERMEALSSWRTGWKIEVD